MLSWSRLGGFEIGRRGARGRIVSRGAGSLALKREGMDADGL